MKVLWNMSCLLLLNKINKSKKIEKILSRQIKIVYWSILIKKLDSFK